MLELVCHRLGNIARIGFLRNLLANIREQFPVLLKKVLYEGAHAGDHVMIDDVCHLAAEMWLFKGVHSQAKDEENLIRHFEQQMSELVDAAQSVRKPIAFL